MFRALRRDIDAALRHDPAARSHWEVLLAYPGLHALALHRVSHALWNRGRFLGARLFSHHARFLTGVEIHPGARIADGVFIDHGMGVVIGETAVIEEGCILYKGVVLGGTSPERRVRHPHLKRNVIVGSNACVLGAITLGEAARIGSASVVIRDVPAGATVVGVPGRVVRERHGPHTESLNHGSLPDPVTDVMHQLSRQQEAVMERLARLERRWGVAEGPEADSREADLRKRLGSIF